MLFKKSFGDAPCRIVNFAIVILSIPKPYPPLLHINPGPGRNNIVVERSSLQTEKEKMANYGIYFLFNIYFIFKKNFLLIQNNTYIVTFLKIMFLC